MTTPALHVEHLRKTYVVPEREVGLRASIRSLVRRRSREVKAVDDINFEIAPGEMVGFLSPNGAGKTATLKMLSGLLHPSGGTADVLDFAPQRRDKQFFKQITLVEQFAAYKTIVITLEDALVSLDAYGDVISCDEDKVTLRVPKADTSRVTARILQDVPHTDLSIEDPPIEDMIERVFAQEQPDVVAG